MMQFWPLHLQRTPIAYAFFSGAPSKIPIFFRHQFLKTLQRIQIAIDLIPAWAGAR